MTIMTLEVGPWKIKSTTLIMGRTHDHLLQVVECPITQKIEHVLKAHDHLLQVVEGPITKNRACVKRLSKPTTMGVTCQVVASLSLY